jgi:proline racemase/trans-L-3-hydroxyproline dehydratase
MTELLIRAVDYHTAGEPFRILTDPLELRGRSVAERRQHAIDDPEINRLRQLLCYEPRGHADMYGGFITPPDDDGAHFGVLFWHKDGFSTACGHGTIALGVWAVQTGLVERSASGTTEVVIDAPSGRVLARVHSAGQRVVDVDFVNVPSYATASDVEVPTSQGATTVTLAFGGAFYAMVDTAAFGFRVTQEHLPQLIALAREIRRGLNDSPHVQHFSDPRLSGVYGTIFYEDLGPSADGDLLQRNVTIFADGEVDRSPCGSGTCARLAALHAAGGITIGQVLTHESIVGSRFQARVLETVMADQRPAVLPQVTGIAHKTGEHAFVVDPDDDLTPGFVLR